MTSVRFEPSDFYQFDLSHGAVRTRYGGRVLVLSDRAVAPLVASAVRQGDLTAIRRLGRQLGEAARSSLGADPQEHPPETVLGHAAGVLALFGWGRLGLERWGDALVASLAQVPDLDDDQLGVAALLGGLFSELGKRDVACVPVAHEGRFLLLDPSVAERVWTLARSGEELPAIVGKLTRGGDA